MGTASSDVSFRAFAPDDIEGCLAVFDSNVPEYFTPSERAEFAAFLTDLPGYYFVLVASIGEVVGCGGYARSELPRTADLCWGMIRRDLHGRGLGRLLTHLRLEEVQNDPAVAAIRLHTSQHTKGFYARLGFRVTGVTPDGYAPGLDRCDMLLDLA